MSPNSLFSSLKFQSLLLIVVILVSLLLTQIKPRAIETANISSATSNTAATIIANNLSFETAAVGSSPTDISIPVRRWDVLDPPLNSVAVLVESLDDNVALFRYHSQQAWPMASITKLITAAIVLEDIGEDKKIPISPTAVATEGIAGGLQREDIYTSRDLIKIMLITSSNDAATAFEEYLGGREEFSRKANRFVEALGMARTILHDASGLSDLNESTAEDITTLLKYIATSRPNILNWTRIEHLIVQPINVPESRTVSNVNPLSYNVSFLGGKTGTSPESNENLASIISFKNRRLAIIVLGSSDRLQEVDNLLAWLDEAYLIP